MNDTGVKAFVLSLLDATGLKKAVTSIMSTMLSFGVDDIAQLVAAAVGIVTGIMAIKHYAVSIQLNKAKLAKLNEQDGAA
ncbi:hypothetical protein F0249_10415 [Vibrio sp. 03-59-1]|uniref:hypothetical protein n=1 Tax=Vibrio sp. 03-59-1 TaxID=2607607 RepID=UPI001493DBBC|nr:hypothetical protein [Vibrio sp. 03-59-1]NOH84227.1 hypothetical protein [Vibrio sp. 03-59-1]